MITLLLIAISRKKRERERKQNRVSSRQTLLIRKGAGAAVMPSAASEEYSLQLNGLCVGKRFPSAGTWGSDLWHVNL